MMMIGVARIDASHAGRTIRRVLFLHHVVFADDFFHKGKAPGHCEPHHYQFH